MRIFVLPGQNTVTTGHSHGYLLAAEIASMAGIEKAEVDKIIKALKKEELIVSPKNCYYTVK